MELKLQTQIAADNGGGGRSGALRYDAHRLRLFFPNFQSPGPCPPFNPQIQVQPTPLSAVISVTASIPPGPFPHGLIGSGRIQLPLTTSGLYSLSILPGVRSRQLRVTFFRGNCFSRHISLLPERDPLPVQAWQIEAEPDVPAVTGHHQGLYWTGPTYDTGLKKLWSPGKQYQERFGDQLPDLPHPPPRHGLCFPVEAVTSGLLPECGHGYQNHLSRPHHDSLCPVVFHACCTGLKACLGGYLRGRFLFGTLDYEPCCPCGACFPVCPERPIRGLKKRKISAMLPAFMTGRRAVRSPAYGQVSLGCRVPWLLKQDETG